MPRHQSSIQITASSIRCASVRLHHYSAARLLLGERWSFGCGASGTTKGMTEGNCGHVDGNGTRVPWPAGKTPAGGNPSDLTAALLQGLPEGLSEAERMRFLQLLSHVARAGSLSLATTELLNRSMMALESSSEYSALRDVGSSTAFFCPFACSSSRA